MFKIEMLQAGWGDCLWIEYGSTENPYRILIDGGITSTYELIKKRILALPENKRQIELFVITHIDGDHIEGAIKLLGRIKQLKVTFGDIWFNGYEHIRGEADRMGGIHGEFLSALLKKRNLNWNKSFGGRAVVVPEKGALPVIELPGNLRLTLLSPTRENLKNLVKDWNKDVKKHGLEKNKSLKAVLEKLQERSSLRPEDELNDRLGQRRIPVPVKTAAEIRLLGNSNFQEDTAKANGSSIAFLLEYKSEKDDCVKTCLLTGDAFPSVVSRSLKRLLGTDRSKLKIDLLKVSHHGSRNNTNKDLVKLIECRNYFFSSSGQRFYHPDKETIARILVHGADSHLPRLFFNYLSKFNETWNDQKLKKGRYPYEPLFVKNGEDGITLHL